MLGGINLCNVPPSPARSWQRNGRFVEPWEYEAGVYSATVLLPLCTSLYASNRVISVHSCSSSHAVGVCGSRLGPGVPNTVVFSDFD